MVRQAHQPLRRLKPGETGARGILPPFIQKKGNRGPELQGRSHQARRGQVRAGNGIRGQGARTPCGKGQAQPQARTHRGGRWFCFKIFYKISCRKS